MLDAGARRRRRPRDHRRDRRSPAPTRRSRSPSSTTASTPRSASTRTTRASPTPGGSTSSASCSRTERAVAVGETGLDYFRDYAPHDAQRRLFEAQLELAAELGKPVVIHTRAADEDTLAALAGFDGTVVLHCFSSPALLEPALERGWYVSFAGNVTYPKAPELREAARRVPRRPPPRRDRQPVPRAAAGARPAERAGVRRSTRSPPSREARGEDAGRARARRSTRTPPPPSGFRERSSRRRQLGQHFLVDENILGVIGRLAELEPDDVVLEIGPGLGILTRYLADRVAHVHAVELDRSLEPRSARHRRDTSTPLAGRARARPRRRSCPRRRSSSRTCRTTSPRRWSSRASTGCRASSSGA